MPIFWLGLVFMLIFSLNLGWLPISGRLSIGIDLDVITNFYILDAILTRNWAALRDAVWHIIMPAVTLSTIPTAIVARMTRSAMLDVLRQDYIKTAKAKGLSNLTRHFQTCPAQCPHSGRYHNRPSVRRSAGRCDFDRDHISPGPVWASGCTMRSCSAITWSSRAARFLSPAIFVFINLCVDVLYAVINPRMSMQ